MSFFLGSWGMVWFGFLRIYVDLAVFQPYLDLEAGDNQSLKIQVARRGIEPRSSCSASQELNHSATAAPSWGMNLSAEQTYLPRTALRFTGFFCPVLGFIPLERRKRHSFFNWLEQPAYYGITFFNFDSFSLTGLKECLLELFHSKFSILL